jgi:hypothetical protein
VERALVGRRTCPLANSRFRVNPVNLWTLRGVNDSLQDRRFPCICSSNDEDSELELGEDPLCHDTKVFYADEGLARGLGMRESCLTNSMYFCACVRVDGTRDLSGNCCTLIPTAQKIRPTLLELEDLEASTWAK